MSDATRYDEILYPTGAQDATHPDRLATIATLFGMSPAPATACRVLEIGCGDANNLIPMAFLLPGASFTGIDLAEKPIAIGKDLASKLGLRNLHLEAKDLFTITPDFGEFDYIIAHGVYAWIPAAVQDKLMEVCRANLAPQGVAFVSYNAYPGSRLRETVRDLFTHFIRPLDARPDAIAHARRLLEFAAKARPETGPWGPIMAQVSTMLGGRPDTVLAHDEMGACYRPAYFHEFAARAARHGLQYLGEANYGDMQDRWLSPEERDLLARTAGDPVLLREQYMDFLKCRTFRHTLLCRKEVALNRDAAPLAALKLLVSSRLRPESKKAKLDAPGPVTFQHPAGGGLSISHPSVKKLLARLGDAWPDRIPASGLRAKDIPDDELGDFLLFLYGANLARLQTHWTPYACPAGPRPTATPLARALVDQRKWVTTHEHVEVQIKDATTQQLLRAMDGTRERKDLLAEVRKLDPKVTPESLESTLQGLAELGLLSA